MLLKARTVNGGVDLLRLNGEVDAVTTNGGVDLRQVAGKIEVATTNGSVDVDDARGSVSAHTTNGRIRVTLAEVTPNAEMSFRTTNGSVALALPSDIRTHLKARTTNGSISSDFELPPVANGRPRKSVDTDLNGGGGTLEVLTTNGGISIDEV